MLDGYGGDESKLNDKTLVFKCLDELPTKLGMSKLSEPLIVEAMDNAMKDPGGWSGFIIILESHISIHTFPKRGFVSADVYTCKNGVDIRLITNYFTETFKLSDSECNLIKRGTRYPSQNL